MSTDFADWHCRRLSGLPEKMMERMSFSGGGVLPEPQAARNSVFAIFILFNDPFLLIKRQRHTTQTTFHTLDNVLKTGHMSITRVHTNVA